MSVIVIMNARTRARITQLRSLASDDATRDICDKAIAGDATAYEFCCKALREIEREASSNTVQSITRDMSKTMNTGAAVYQAACDAHNAAYKAFANVTDAYRARTIGDDVFLAAKAEMQKADAIFDVAFNIYCDEVERAQG